MISPTKVVGNMPNALVCRASRGALFYMGKRKYLKIEAA